MLGIFVVMSFVLVQFVATVLLVSTIGSVQVRGDISAREALAVGVVQVFGIVAILAFVLGRGTTWARLGVWGPAGATMRGFEALLPVGLLVIVPSMVVAALGDGRLLDADLTVGMAAIFVVLAVLIAANEELWFRGLLVDSLGLARRPWLTVVGSALLFGVPHVGDTRAHVVNAVAVTLAVGVPFTVVRLRTGGLGALIAWHALIDTWAFLHTASVTPQGSPDAGDVAATLVLPSLMAIGYCVWFARWLRGGGGAG